MSNWHQNCVWIDKNAIRCIKLIVMVIRWSSSTMTACNCAKQIWLMLTRKAGPRLFRNLIIKRDRAAQTPIFASMINSRLCLFPWLFVYLWGCYWVYKLVGWFIGSLLVGCGGRTALWEAGRSRLQHYPEYLGHPTAALFWVSHRFFVASIFSR